MTRLFFILFISVCSSVPSWLRAQEDLDPIIGIETKTSPAEIILKWYPSTYQLWQEGLRKGYVVSRKLVQINGKDIPGQKYIRLTDTPIKPVDKNTLALMIDTNVTLKSAILAVDGDSMNYTTPEDPIEAASQLENRKSAFGMALIANSLNRHVAYASGNLFIDKSVQAREKYLYKVEIEGADISYDVGYQLAEATTPAPLPQPYGLSMKFDEDIAYLKWNGSYEKGGFAYYDIYRSTKENKGFQKVNDLPYLSMGQEMTTEKGAVIFTDSVPEYNTTYYYKIVGVNGFGDRSPYSKVVKGMALRDIESPPGNMEFVVTDEGDVKMTWEMDERQMDGVAHFEIERAPEPTQTFELIHEEPIDAKKREFLDEDPLPSNYYRACAVSFAGNKLCSQPYIQLMIDSIPPAQPTGLEGKIDTNGIVTLYWKPNSESDLEGYRVYRSNTAEQEYDRQTVGYVADTTFVDTVDLDLLYRHVYYKIFAIDKHGNPSEFSVPVKILKPDKHPPLPPQFREVVSTDTGIYLHWINSASEDLKKQVLYRKGGLDLNFRPIKTLTDDQLEQKEYLDNNTKPRTFYQYMLLAWDEGGLQSDTAHLASIEQLSAPVKPAVSDLRAIVSRPNKLLKLTWQYPLDGAISRFLIYRGYGEKPVRFYKTVEGTVREYYDKNLRPDAEYQYYVVAEYKDGTRSSMDKSVKVVY